jgi:uncharacterized protein
MATYRTPDVYVEEISVFPPSVAEVETAIPAFVGYTAFARNAAGLPLAANTPEKIYSFAQFEQQFGGPPTPAIAVTLTANGDGFSAGVTPPTPNHLLHHAMKMYFDNGGGKCWVVSVGDYSAVPAIGPLSAGLAAVQSEDEPTLLVCPEAVRLGAVDYATLVQAMLGQCGRLKDRFAVMDLLDGTNAAPDLEDNREHFGTSDLKYGAVYYPFVRSSINHPVAADESNVNVTVGAAAAVALGTLRNTATAAYNAAKAALRDHYIVMPPSAAVAGVYANVDTTRGVWKAPANVSLRDVIEPMVRLDNPRQDELNVDADSGKSINAIRAFAGKGTLVWGARTLAGNDNEWRYVSVRRFFNMVEESVKKSTYWAVFEPNDANTWVKVRGMIENYLTQKWREGALAGATTKDAFFVRCSLGTTMNAQDILEGRMNVEIGMAVVRPAEFIILKFSHKLQTS